MSEEVQNDVPTEENTKENAPVSDEEKNKALAEETVAEVVVAAVEQLKCNLVSPTLENSTEENTEKTAEVNAEAGKTDAVSEDAAQKTEDPQTEATAESKEDAEPNNEAPTKSQEDAEAAAANEQDDGDVPKLDTHHSEAVIEDMGNAITGEEPAAAPQEPEEATPHEPEEPAPAEREKPAKSPRAPRKKAMAQTTPVQPTNVFSDDELKKMLEKMLKTKKSPEISAIPEMKRYVENEMREAALEGKYDYGSKLEEADEMMDKFLIVDNSAFEREQRRKEYENKLNDTKKKLEETKKSWEEKIAKLREEQAERMTELEAEHKAQIDEFEKKWADPNYLTQFNKPSQQLLGLRQVEEKLAMSKLFDRAKDIRMKAEKMQKAEIEEAQRRAVGVMKNEWEALDTKQKREVECLLAYTKRNVELFEKKRDTEMHPLEQVVQRLAPLANPQKVCDRKKVLWEETKDVTPRPIRNVQGAKTMKTGGNGLGVGGISVRRYIKTTKTPPKSPRNSKRGKAED